MARILEIVVYILFAMLSFYKFFNDYIEINKEYGYKIAIYIAIFFYLIFEKYGHNITYIVIIGAFIFIQWWKISVTVMKMKMSQEMH